MCFLVFSNIDMVLVASMQLRIRLAHIKRIRYYHTYNLQRCNDNVWIPNSQFSDQWQRWGILSIILLCDQSGFDINNQKFISTIHVTDFT